MKKNEKGLFEKHVDAKGVVLDLANRGMVEDFWVELEPLKPLIECMRNTEWDSDEQINELLTFIATTLKINENRLRRFYYEIPEPEFAEENPAPFILLGIGLDAWNKLSKEAKRDIIELIKKRDLKSAKALAKRLIKEQIGLNETEPHETPDETIEYYEEEEETEKTE